MRSLKSAVVAIAIAAANRWHSRCPGTAHAARRARMGLGSTRHDGLRIHGTWHDGLWCYGPLDDGRWRLSGSDVQRDGKPYRRPSRLYQSGA